MGQAPLLFTPIRLGALALPNRIAVAPMCQYSASDGCATEWHRVHLGTLALSGAGLLIIEATAVEPEGRISPGDLGLWSDGTEAALADALRTVRAVSGVPLAIQLAHAGRKASSRAPWDGGRQIPQAEGGWLASAPTASPHHPGEEPPAALDRAGLARVRTAFADAARRALRLGFDAIELHAAHGYLLHQFLSPLANGRDDEYGGPRENRMRFPLEVVAAVLDAVAGRMPVGVRLSGTDWVEGGWDATDAAAFAAKAERLGCAFVHVSSGGVSPRQSIRPVPGYQVPLAAAVKRAVGVPVIAVGLITDPAQAESVLAAGDADMVALARGMLFDPRWPWHAAATLGGQVTAPKQYWRCQPSGLRNLFGDTTVGQR